MASASGSSSSAKATEPTLSMSSQSSTTSSFDSEARCEEHDGRVYLINVLDDGETWTTGGYIYQLTSGSYEYVCDNTDAVKHLEKGIICEFDLSDPKDLRKLADLIERDLEFFRSVYSWNIWAYSAFFVSFIF